MVSNTDPAVAGTVARFKKLIEDVKAEYNRTPQSRTEGQLSAEGLDAPQELVTSVLENTNERINEEITAEVGDIALQMHRERLRRISVDKGTNTPTKPKTAVGTNTPKPTLGSRTVVGPSVRPAEKTAIGTNTPKTKTKIASTNTPKTETKTSTIGTNTLKPTLGSRTVVGPGVQPAERVAQGTNIPKTKTTSKSTQKTNTPKPATSPKPVVRKETIGTNTIVTAVNTELKPLVSLKDGDAIITENELRELQGIVHPKGTSEEKITFLDVNKKHWDDQSKAEKTAGHKEKAELYDSFAKLSELKSDQIRLRQNQKPESERVQNIMDEETDTNDLTRFQRFRKWAKEPPWQYPLLASSPPPSLLPETL